MYCWPFFLKVKRSTKFCFVALWKRSSEPRTCWSLYPRVSLAFLDKLAKKVSAYLDKAKPSCCFRF